MRPRHKAAENVDDLVEILLTAASSMRPRHKAAENLETDRAGPRTCRFFNEAAA